ncbi:orotidine-5'-phosphate decarboxylase [Neobacillus sp. D3-1R]|uniref:orotidine-5'-phosphate decarboxylase n=1 Tax=Neobacillus sp. D3-1R TaxID=3445778 RepID=UPI003FA13ACF
MKNSLIIALDFSNKTDVVRFLEPFQDEKLFVKVGMELFFQEGPDILSFLKGKGHQIFLDLKLHDIPNTVYRAMKGLASIGCDLVNVHAAGGTDMMKAALEGLEEGTLAGQTRPYCIAVTQLTSTSEEQMQKEQLIKVPLEDSVLNYASLAKEAGLDGIVCSVFESRKIQEVLGADFLTVCPGIRQSTLSVQDQKRVATPKIALANDVSAIVVGRPITQAENPVDAYRLILNEWSGVKA